MELLRGIEDVDNEVARLGADGERLQHEVTTEFAVSPGDDNARAGAGTVRREGGVHHHYLAQVVLSHVTHRAVVLTVSEETVVETVVVAQPLVLEGTDGGAGRRVLHVAIRVSNSIRSCDIR